MSDIRLDDVSVEYTSGGYRVRPLSGLSHQLFSGELTVVIGPSGCGKTTLLSCLAGILRPTSGRIFVGDMEIGSLGAKELTAYRLGTVGLIFQAFNLLPSLSAADNIAVPMLAAGKSSRHIKERTAELLERVGLADRAHHLPGQLSGGQQQRVAIARALANDPPVLLADEPTAHLDYIQVDGVLRVFRELVEPGRAVMIVTHDDRLLALTDQVMALGTREVRADPTEAFSHTLDPGEVLFRQGETGIRAYVVEEGSVNLFREMADGSEELLTIAKPGSYFGEIAALVGLPRTATARSTDGAVLTSYSATEFRKLLAGRLRGRGPGEAPGSTS
jgi:putative ABC transport system ATP-binding protein